MPDPESAETSFLETFGQWIDQRYGNECRDVKFDTLVENMRSTDLTGIGATSGGIKGRFKIKHLNIMVTYTYQPVNVSTCNAHKRVSSKLRTRTPGCRIVFSKRFTMLRVKPFLAINSTWTGLHWP